MFVISVCFSVVHFIISPSCFSDLTSLSSPHLTLSLSLSPYIVLVSDIKTWLPVSLLQRLGQTAPNTPLLYVPLILRERWKLRYWPTRCVLLSSLPPLVLPHGYNRLPRRGGSIVAWKMEDIIRLSFPIATIVFHVEAGLLSHEKWKI